MILSPLQEYGLNYWEKISLLPWYFEQKPPYKRKTAE